MDLEDTRKLIVYHLDDKTLIQFININKAWVEQYDQLFWIGIFNKHKLPTDILSNLSKNIFIRSLDAVQITKDICTDIYIGYEYILFFNAIDISEINIETNLKGIIKTANFYKDHDKYILYFNYGEKEYSNTTTMDINELKNFIFHAYREYMFDEWIYC